VIEPAVVSAKKPEAGEALAEVPADSKDDAAG